MFAGRLTPSSSRSGQTPEAARERLPAFIGACRDRALRIEVTCCTDTAERYNEKDHVMKLGSICASNRESVISMEMWNEVGHSTQRHISYDELIELKNIARSSGYDGPIALGAASIDELDPATGKYPTAWTGPNAFSTMHLNRGKKPSYREANRVKEFYDVRNKHNCGACNNEPSRFDDAGFNEPDGHGQERFAYLLGVLGVGFNFMSIAHGTCMRDVRVPSGVEEAALTQYLRAASLVERAQYTWYNANNTGSWPMSPVKSGAFMEGPANNSDKALWRAYSFVSSFESFVVASGERPEKFNIEYQNGWRPIGMIDEFPGIQVIQISQ